MNYMSWTGAETICSKKIRLFSTTPFRLKRGRSIASQGRRPPTPTQAIETRPSNKYVKPSSGMVCN